MKPKTRIMFGLLLIISLMLALPVSAWAGSGSIPVIMGSDDADQITDGTSDTTFGSMFMASWYMGVRFQSVPIPKGAVVTNAYIEFESRSGVSNVLPGSVQYHAEDVDSAATFASGVSA